ETGPRFVVMHAAGPKWAHDRPAFEQAGVRAHVEHYRKLLDDGRLVLGGPFLDDVGGGMMVAAPGVSRDEPAALAAEDPAVRDGLLTFELRSWFVGMRSSA